ncbi:MAG TPA: hypothetical protein PLL76_23180 [Thermoanaerobaculia bacterium]|nr:hypothetical protein [Thermoanaerobaculia bacterium]
MSTLASEAVRRRYRDAYGVANTIGGVGGTIKIAGVLAASVVVFAAFYAAKTVGTAPALAVSFLGALAGAVLYVFGVLVAAQGQIQKAMLDVAVNSSPHLSVDEKASLVIGVTSHLPREPLVGSDGVPVSAGSHDTGPEPAPPPLSPEERAAERARGVLSCRSCGKLISPGDRKACRDNELCEDHLP